MWEIEKRIRSDRLSLSEGGREKRERGRTRKVGGGRREVDGQGFHPLDGLLFVMSVRFKPSLR